MLLQKYMPGKKVEDINHNYVECLLYTFHHLAHKVRFAHQLWIISFLHGCPLQVLIKSAFQTPNTTNSLCGYKIVTGQPSDRLGEDFSEHYKDFTER